MQNSHLIVVLKTFSKKEGRDLQKWLESPAHNQREDVITLLEYLFTNGHLESDKHLKKEKIYSKIFPGEPFDDAKLRQTMHFLLKTVEEFLIYQEFQENVTYHKVLLASNYLKRNLEKPFHKAIRTAEEIQYQSPYQEEQYLRNEFLIEQEKNEFQSSRQRTAKINFQELSDMLDISYIATKLRHGCAMLSHQAVYKTAYDTGLLDEALRYIESKNLLHIPAIAVYYNIYKTITASNEPKFFEQLVQQIQENGHLFPETVLRSFYLHTINYCIRKINSGEEAYVRTSFELYRQGLEKKILLENDSIDPILYRNIAVNGIRLHEFKWVEQFIYAYKEHLEEQHQENFFQFTLARLRFEQKDYGAAMGLLAKTDFSDILIQLNAKTMLMKIYYELEETDALESLLESMRTYLNRKGVIAYHRLNYQNVIKYTKKLVRTNPYNKTQIAKLRQEITAANPLTEKAWLLKQLEEM